MRMDESRPAWDWQWVITTTTSHRFPHHKLSDDSNVLYHNDGDGNFTDLTFQAGLGEVTVPFLGGALVSSTTTMMAGRI